MKEEKQQNLEKKTKKMEFGKKWNHFIGRQYLTCMITRDVDTLILLYAHLEESMHLPESSDAKTCRLFKETRSEQDKRQCFLSIFNILLL